MTCGNSSGAEFGALQYQQYQGMRLLQGLTPTACGGGDGPDGNPVFTNLTPTVPTVPDSPTYADDMLQAIGPRRNTGCRFPGRHQHLRDLVLELDYWRCAHEWRSALATWQSKYSCRLEYSRYRLQQSGIESRDMADVRSSRIRRGS
jgi:hypothetical protein